MTKENPIDEATETIRSLRNSLHFAMLEAKNNVVKISGASPTVGKSFVSSYLAIVLAQAGQKVLLIDADMRKGYILKLFDQKVENGLSELLTVTDASIIGHHPGTSLMLARFNQPSLKEIAVAANLF